MPNTTQEKLYETFVAISGSQPSSRDPMIDASEELAGSVSKIAKVVDRVATPKADTAGSVTMSDPSILAGLLAAPAAATVVPAAATALTTASNSTNTAGSIASTLLQNVFGAVPLVGAVESAQSSHSGGIGGTVESIASTVLKSGLGLVPLIGSLLGLFGGGDSAEPAPLVKYAMPASIAFQGADTPSGTGFLDYDQAGMPRTYGTTATAPTSPFTAPQITVNVQAMDARSFLDRSSDIAAAVREAMLNLNSLNDVVSEL
jgi:hypothetical protein